MVVGNREVTCPECKELDEICVCNKCDECFSTNLKYYDDGEGYPPNIECLDCGNFSQ